MICCCTRCRFLFEAIRLLERCPDCGKAAVREATAPEKADYVRYRKECGSMRVFGAPVIVQRALSCQTRI